MIKNLSSFIFLFLLSFLCIYVFFISKQIRTGPEFSNVIYIVEDNVLHIKGNVKDSSYFSINDLQLYPEKNGNFEHYLSVANGYIIVELYARNKINRENKYLIEFYNKENEKKINYDKEKGSENQSSESE